MYTYTNISFSHCISELMLNYRYVVYDTIHLYFTYKIKQLTPHSRFYIYFFIKEMDNQNQLQSQFRCDGCSTVLAFPVGVPSVRCPICQTVTPIQNIRVQCSSCNACLVVPQNTTCAMCPLCSNVMSVARPISSSGGMPPDSRQHQEKLDPASQHVQPNLNKGAIPKNPALAAAMGRQHVK